MKIPVSPALQKTETALRVSPDSFTKNNYHSVFDIIRQPRKQFISANISWLGLRGGKAWDLAMGQAQHIRRLFREKQLTRQVRQGIQRTLSGQPSVNRKAVSGIQGLIQDGPDWQNQFNENWQAYCQSGSPEAYDSPVSYLTWLYNQALTYEQEIANAGFDSQIISLATRRPDLPTLVVDNDAVNQVIPTLQLVNEILESSIASSIPSGSTVDNTLASTRYPTLLPYHFPHDQVELSLQNTEVALEDIIGQTSTDWPWFLNASLTGVRSINATELASQLAPEQQTIITESDVRSDWSTFYNTNLGLDTPDYSPFEELDTFTYQLGITAPETEQLIAGNAGGSSVVISPNDLPVYGVSDATDNSYSMSYGASFINNDTGTDPITLISTREYNSTHIPKDTGSNPTALTMSENGLSVIPGKFNTGLRCDATQHAEMYIADNISTDGSTLQTFTLSFWCKIPADVKDQALLITNKTDQDPLSAKGISCLIQNSEIGYQISLSASDGSNDPLSVGFDFKPDNWIFIAIRHKENDSKLYVRGSTDGVNMDIATSINISELDSIARATDDWGFNSNIENAYYNAYPERRSVIDYDDICSWDSAISDEDLQVIIASKDPAGGRTDMYHYYALDGTQVLLLSSLSDARMDRINRMVRLQRWLGLSYEETDLLLSACIAAQGTNNTDYTLNTHTLRMLGVFRHWQQKYNVTAFQFAAVLHQITPYAISPAVPFLDQVFNSPSLFDEPFAITGESVSYTETTGDSARVVRQICTGLGITQAQFRVLADSVAAQQGDATAKTFPLTLDSVSAFYRLVMIPRWLGLSFAEGSALLSLVGSNIDEQNFIHISDDTGSHPTALTMSENGLSVVPGKFNTGLRCDATQQAEMYIADNISTDGSTLQSFTLSFWCKIPADVKDQALLITNKTEQDPLSARGLSILVLNSDDDYQLSFSASDGSHTPVSLIHGFTPDIWIFIAINHQEGSNKIYIRASTGGSTMDLKNSLDVSGLNSVARATDDWGFNSNKDNAYYNAYPERRSVIDYDDICSWDSVISDEDLNEFLTNKPAAGRTDMYHYYALDETQDSVWAVLSGVPHLAELASEQPAEGDILDILMALDTATDWTKEHSLSWIKNYLDLHATPTTLIASSETVSFVNSIKQQLPASLLSEQSFVSVLLPSDSIPDGWLGVINDLVDANGLVLSAATDYDTILTMVTADFTDLTYDSDSDKNQAISTLTGIIYQAMLAQNGIADSALSQMFKTPQLLSVFLLQWANDSEYRLLSDSLTMNSDADITDPATIPADYLTHLYTLGQRAGITTQFNLTPAALGTFLAHPNWLDANYTDLTLSLALLHRFSRYSDWLTLATKEDAVLAYLLWVNATTPPDTEKAASALAALLGWESDEVSLATAPLTGGLAKTVADVDYVMRLQTLSSATKLSVTPLLDTGELATGNVTDTWDAWQSAGESLVAAQTDQQ
jgi:hypothetical protein